ncbi:Crp/Fnr family transcriptional regulator [Serratia sp. 2723]|uniref:Crp/Fnr family transcriptional regulator n=1 Tax=unclassified Serratia (in: enterobacteria) TaxID=2647522 RepID=UPI003D1CBFD7
MAHMSRENAEHIVCQRGWLSKMPDTFRKCLLQHAQLLKFDAGEVIFQPGDPAGGIYGMVAGTVIVSTAPPDAKPRLIHLALPGGWTGEDSFLTRQPRRIELVAQNETWVMHVPLETMEQMAQADPENIRAFGIISVMASDSLLRIVHDLQKKSVSARIASVLHRMCWTSDVPVCVSQENLSIIANTSRKQANSVVQQFVAAGWVEVRYRSITVTNPSALRQHAEQP